ncbi:MAG: DUF2779 domain-containing protein [Bacteroidota bacterium]|nr:DUF2779 domain-containing protein [Bacteroidota bacterium]
MKAKKNHVISKSSFIKGTQCLKALYLSKHHPELRDEISKGQQAIFDQGHEVGELAQQLFPGGVLAAKDLPEGFIESIEQTQKLISQGHEVIYEAGFMVNNLHCFVDILVKQNGKWHIYEVKSSTGISDTHILDVAFQYYVLSNMGLEVEDVYIVHINNQYVRQGDLDIQQLFNIESVLVKGLGLQDFIGESLNEQVQVLQDGKIPKIDIGPHCKNPYDCDFRGYCWKHLPEYSVFNIHNLRGEKKFDLYDKGFIELKDIPEDYPLGVHQRFQVKAELENITKIDRPRIRGFLDRLEYPLYFLDFETMNPAIPLYDQSKPYQAVPFQFSLHIQKAPDADLEHIEYLGDPTTDPRPGLIEKMLDSIGKTGDIIVYNLGFEKSRIKEMARDFPDNREELLNLTLRLKDLMLLFQRKHYYTPAMMGSYSIKKVLPALVPEFSYDDLEIGEGGLASRAYFQMVKGKSDDIDKTRKNLLEYCKMDTLGMVEIMKILST